MVGWRLNKEAAMVISGRGGRRQTGSAVSYTCRKTSNPVGREQVFRGVRQTDLIPVSAPPKYLQPRWASSC